MIASLVQVPEFERLPEVLHELDIDVILHGSVARRLVFAAAQSSSATQWPSLIDLSPFISDIDILHTGPPNLDSRVYAALHRVVPFAECFRWEVRSAAAYAGEFNDARFTSAIVPANSVAVSCLDGVADPWRYLDDPYRVRLIRNGFYGQSRRAKAGMDLEVFGVLLWLKVLGEMRSVEIDQHSIDDAHKIIATLGTAEVVGQLQESCYLRTRLRYLLKGIATTAASSSNQSISSLVKALADALPHSITSEDLTCELLPVVTPDMRAVQDSEPVCVSSCRVRGDQFRLPQRTRLWASGEGAKEALDVLLDDTPLIARAEGSLSRKPTLAPNLEVALASPPMRCVTGVAPSARSGADAAIVRKSEPPPSDEFIHFALPSLPSRNVDLATVLGLRFLVKEQSKSLVIPIASAITELAPSGASISVRINCGSLLQDLDTICERLGPGCRADAHVFLLESRDER